MSHDEAYLEAEQKIQEALQSGATKLNLSNMKLTELPDSLGQLTQLTNLNLSNNQLTTLPDLLGQLTQLTNLNLSDNQLTTLPDSLGQLTQLQQVLLGNNQISALPEALGNLKKLKRVYIYSNKLNTLPNWIGNLQSLTDLSIGGNQISDLPNTLAKLSSLESLFLGINTNTFEKEKGVADGNPFVELPLVIKQIRSLKLIRANNCKISDIPDWLSTIPNLSQIYIENNAITDLPPSFAQIEHLRELDLDNNPLNPELAEAYEQGLSTVKDYLRAKAESGEIVLNEAKLILVGEGGVGKTSLLAALRGDEWVEGRETTHGVEVDIRSMLVKDPDTGKEITLNGWDFGGQNIYRHTHQLFFTAPAIYLAVWEPRRGPEQSRVAEWIKMVKHRAYDEARPDERPRVLVVATHGGPKERLDHIDEQALRDEFGDMICGFYHVDSKPDENGVCYQLVQLKEAIAREAASIPSVGRKVPVSWKKILEAIRRRSERDPYIPYSRFEALCHRQGISNDIVSTYATILNELGHLIYYRGDETLKDTVILKPDYLSKAVSFVLEDKTTKDSKGLIEHNRLSEIWHNPARPEKERYPKELHPVFLRLMQRFDLSYQVVMPEAEAASTSLMAQLVPGIRPEGWEADWVLKPGDVERTQVCRILDSLTGRTVEAEGLMYRLIVRLHRYSLGRKNYHDSRHWKTGLMLEDGFNGLAFIEEIGGDVYVTVRAAYPERFLSHLCSEIQWLVDHFWKGLDAKLFIPCQTADCKGLLELDEIMDFKIAGMPKVRCSVCTKFHEIDSLMATVAPKPELQDAIEKLSQGQKQILNAVEKGFDSVDVQLRTIMSQADEQFEALLTTLVDPAKDGPRLFSFEPVDRSRFNPQSWTSEEFWLTLWCEHRRVPLPILNNPGDTRGVFKVKLTREWVKKAAPVLKVISTTLSLALRIAVPGTKLATNDTAYDAIAEQLEFGVTTADMLIEGGENIGNWLIGDESSELEETRKAIQAQGSVLRELHALLKQIDPANSYGGLMRVQNKRKEFLWVHEKFAGEY